MGMQKTRSTKTDMNPTSVAAAHNVARLRAEHCWPRQELLERLARHGITMQPTALRRIESSEQRIRLDEAVAFASIFDVTLDELITSTDSNDGSNELVVAARRRARSAGRQLRGLRYELEEAHTELQPATATDQVKALREQLNRAIRDIDLVTDDLLGSPELQLLPKPKKTPVVFYDEPETAADRAADLGVIGYDDAARIGSRAISSHPLRDVQREADRRSRQ